MRSASLDPIAVHRYLTFSFIPRDEPNPFADVRERIDPALADSSTAERVLEPILRRAVESRLPADRRVGLYLSGGLDSSIVAVLLRELGADVLAFSLDFGEHSVEKAEAQLVADHLGIPIRWVPCTGAELAQRLPKLARACSLPYGDAVTGPHLLLAEAAAEAGRATIFNGEGGDQLFGGWTNKPMIAATVFDAANEARETMYLRSYHRFHGLAAELYTPAFRDALGTAIDCRALLSPYFQVDRASTFLGQIRLADLCLKGSWNIIPRMHEIAAAAGVSVQAPLFDADLIDAAFRLPPQMKLHGSEEKYILKNMFRRRLPATIIDRRKSGMCVPSTDWLFGPLQSYMNDCLSDEAIAKRGWFRVEFVQGLRAGIDLPHEVRRRRIGEKLWALFMLEIWLREHPRSEET